jgi:hypothetical protein
MTGMLASYETGCFGTFNDRFHILVGGKWLRRAIEQVLDLLVPRCLARRVISLTVQDGCSPVGLVAAHVGELDSVDIVTRHIGEVNASRSLR